MFVISCTQGIRNQMNRVTVVILQGFHKILADKAFLFFCYVNCVMPAWQEMCVIYLFMP